MDLFDKDEVIRAFLENRTARRTVFPQLRNKCEVYFRFVCTLDENIKYILEKSQKDFAAFLGI